MTDYLLDAYKQGFCEDCEKLGQCDDDKTNECLAEFVEKTRENPLPIQPQERMR